MRATAIEFRLRMWIQIVIVILGFWAPWIQPSWPIDLGRRVALLEWLALELSRTGLVRFAYAAPIVIVAGSLVAALGTVLRVWGAAYLGYSTVHHADMQAGGVMAGGPYRYVRNPLYLGGWCMMIAVSLMMPPSGALFAIVLEGIFFLRLILGEEAYLAGQLGEPYQAYLGTVPRLIPRLRSPLPPSDAKPRWLAAISTEITAIGIFAAVAFFSWRFDNQLMVNVVLIAFLVSMVERGLISARIPTGVFVVATAAGWGLLHLRPLRAAIIALGIAIVVYAILPGKITSPR